MAERDGLLDDYLSHGRRFRALDVATLERRWYSAIEQARCAEGEQYVEALHEMNHIEAELQLRGLEPPQPPHRTSGKHN
jgi:hypothetical protein